MIGNGDQLFSDSNLKMMSEIYKSRLETMSIKRRTYNSFAKMARVQIPAAEKSFFFRLISSISKKKICSKPCFSLDFRSYFKPRLLLKNKTKKRKELLVDREVRTPTAGRIRTHEQHSEASYLIEPLTLGHGRIHRFLPTNLLHKFQTSFLILSH